jgi:hypothetical protein
VEIYITRTEAGGDYGIVFRPGAPLYGVAAKAASSGEEYRRISSKIDLLTKRVGGSFQ